MLINCFVTTVQWKMGTRPRGNKKDVVSVRTTTSCQWKSVVKRRLLIMYGELCMKTLLGPLSQRPGGRPEPLYELVTWIVCRVRLETPLELQGRGAGKSNRRGSPSGLEGAFGLEGLIGRFSGTPRCPPLPLPLPRLGFPLPPGPGTGPEPPGAALTPAPPSPRPSVPRGDADRCKTTTSGLVL